MAHEIQFYMLVDEGSPSDVLDRVVSNSRSQGLAILTSGEKHGEGWISASAGTTDVEAAFGATRLELHLPPSLIVDSSIDGVAADDPTGRVRATNSVLFLTLSGPANDREIQTVRAVWRAASSLWDAVPYDEISGFDIIQDFEA